MKLEEAIEMIDMVVGGVRGTRQERANLELAWIMMRDRATEQKGKKEKKQ